MKENLRALTCNLRYGHADGDTLRDLITKECIDVVCAQELSIELAELLSGLLPHGEMSHDQIRKGNGIASRYPVETERIRLPKRDAWVARLSPRHWPRLPFPVELVNVHISGPHVWPYFPHPVRRKAQLAALLNNRARNAGVPYAVFGDFTASPIWPVYKRMSAGHVDAALEACTGQGPNGTWPYLPRLGVKGWLRIDHCFLWGLRAERARTVEIPGSDHLGLLVDISLSKPAV